MRDYGIVSPRFWIGETGRKLRSMPYAQRVAMYLLTAPASEMTGVYYCPVATILNDVGLPSESLARDHEGASKAVIEALKALQSLDFCEFDFDSEYVFVKEMARWQIAEKLKPTDNRVKGIIKTVESMPEPMRARFIARYNDDFSLGFEVEKQQKNEAPSEPLRSQEQEQEQEQDINKNLSDERFSSDSPALALDGESDAPKRAPGIPMQKIVETYNAKLGSTLGVCRQLNAQRKGNLRQRWKDIAEIVESDKPQDVLQGFSDYYAKVSRSDFLMGRKKDCTFKASFDWIHNSSNFLKIFEGNYENGRKQA